MLILILFLIELLIYALLICLLARWFSRFGALSNVAIFLAALIIGLLSGLLTSWLWPRIDSIAYPNMAAMLLGDQLYIWATSTVPAGTPSPHYAIAWPMRTPQIYVFTSLLLFGLAGLGVQAAYNRRSS